MTSHTHLSPTTLLLCRHGQSEWNAQQRVQGQSPQAGGLTAQGRWEAQQLGHRLRTVGVAAIYASDLLRAWETAEIVGALIGLPVQADPRWREIDLGVWQGLRSEELDRRWPMAQIRELDLPRGETGENFAALTRRTLAAIEEIHSRHGGQTAAVICHGGNVRATLLATPAPLDGGPDPRRTPIPNTSVTVVRVNSAGLQATLIADISHLDSAARSAEDANAGEQR
jgi:broad specificity phosphatase PhoE